MRRSILYAALIVLVLLVIAAVVRADHKRDRDGYLIYPYLDLSEPGERGSYYALSEDLPKKKESFSGWPRWRRRLNPRRRGRPLPTWWWRYPGYAPRSN